MRLVYAEALLATGREEEARSVLTTARARLEERASRIPVDTMRSAV